ncbi:MAG TPA: lipid-binding protein [Chitinophagaceae bacterium]|jgi:hypothetical protein
MRKIFFAVIAIITVSLCACKKDTKPGATVAVKTANTWWVTFTLDNQDVYGLGNFLMTTYNTAANDDSLWVDDLGNSWQFKCKAKADHTNLTFATANSQNQYYDITVNLAEGKILPKAGHSRSGEPTDSIYFKATFSDDPTNTYVISGTARTGLAQDDY